MIPKVKAPTPAIGIARYDSVSFAIDILKTELCKVVVLLFQASAWEQFGACMVDARPNVPQTHLSFDMVDDVLCSFPVRYFSKLVDR